MSMLRRLFASLRPRPRMRIEGECIRCGACCENLVLIDRGTPVSTLDQFERLTRRRREYRRFRVRGVDNVDGFINFSCVMLASDRSCSDYENRPAICRDYPKSSMARHGGTLLKGCGYRLVPEVSFAKILERKTKFRRRIIQGRK